jgi:hypothetical protein
VTDSFQGGTYDTVGEGIFVYGSYIKHDSAHVCHKDFQQKFTRVDISAKFII